MPEVIVRVLLCLLVVAMAPLRASAQDLSNMYDAAAVQREGARLRSRVVEVWTKAFEPNLTAEERRALAGVTFETAVGGDPVIGYFSQSRSRVITMPAISLLFFEDLCTAYAWLQVNRYRLETVEEYVTMLKYKEARAFGPRFPPPLRALGIPDDALRDPRVNDLSLRFRNTGYAFILAHELGHVRYQHAGNNVVAPAVSQANERQADQFGLELMRRVSEIPMGAMIFLQASVYYFENRADFGSDAEWQAHLARGATHPLSADRLEALSRGISMMAGDFARGQPNPAAAIDTTRLIGAQFAEFARFLNDPLLQRVMRDAAEKASPATLRPRR